MIDNENRITFQIKGTPLMKFQKPERIRSLYNGHIYAKKLSYFRDLEIETGDNAVGDSFDGLFHVNEGFIRFPETGEQIDLKDALVPTVNSDDYVFCMFGIYPNIENYAFSEEQQQKMKSFGDTALIITDQEEFVKRVTLAAKNAGFTTHFDAVQYYDPSVDSVNRVLSLLGGSWNIAFWKRDSYKYQQEMRFVFTPDDSNFDRNTDHIEFDIGSISDISKVLPSEYVLPGNLTKNK